MSQNTNITRKIEDEFGSEQEPQGTAQSAAAGAPQHTFMSMMTETRLAANVMKTVPGTTQTALTHLLDVRS